MVHVWLIMILSYINCKVGFMIYCWRLIHYASEFYPNSNQNLPWIYPNPTQRTLGPRELLDFMNFCNSWMMKNLDPSKRQRSGNNPFSLIVVAISYQKKWVHPMHHIILHHIFIHHMICKLFLVFCHVM